MLNNSVSTKRKGATKLQLLLALSHFPANVNFLFPLKTSEKQGFSVLWEKEKGKTGKTYFYSFLGSKHIKLEVYSKTKNIVRYLDLLINLNNF